MTDLTVVQGRELNGADMTEIRGLLTEHPDWGRSRLSEELCHLLSRVRVWARKTRRGESETVAICTAVGPGTGTHEGLEAHALLEPQNAVRADAHARIKD